MADTDALQTLPPPIDEVKVNDLGQRLFRLWSTYVTDRKMIEEKWLRNLRQYRKIYDSEILSTIPADRSKAYPGVTQWMVRGTIARLMQMLWPQTEKNYGVKESPLPELSTEQLQKVLDALVAEKLQGNTDPAAVASVQLTTEEIEAAILKFAKGKAERMELKITDDIQEMGFVDLAKKVVRSATIYAVGVAVGPRHRKVPARTWKQHSLSGKWEAVEVQKLKPLFEFLPVWDHYVDMTAVDLAHQDGTFDRHVMTRAEVEALAERPDFMKDRVLRLLAENTKGNYIPQWWESMIKGEPKSAQAPVADKAGRKFEALSYWGAVNGHDLLAAGVTVKEEDLGKTFHANCWMFNNTVVKLKLSPFGDEIRQHHYFVFEEDDLSILGSSQCDVLRDSQLSICETARAALDNMSVIGPMIEVDEDRLVPGQPLAVSKHKTWRTEDNGGRAQNPAVRNITIDSHLMELVQLLNMWMSFAEKESGLPPPSLGDTSGGGSEALRTTKNASMFLGAAALPIRDTVRNYDAFTISVVSALVAWNMKYDPNESRDGDHDIIARGSTSLIAKEVLTGALNEFRASVTPDEVPHLKTRGMLVARMKALDLPLDELLEALEVADANIKAQQDRAERAETAQENLVYAQVRELLTKALEHEASASADGVNAGAAVLKTIIEAIEGAHTASAGHKKADAALIAANKPAAGAK